MNEKIIEMFKKIPEELEGTTYDYRLGYKQAMSDMLEILKEYGKENYGIK